MNSQQTESSRAQAVCDFLVPPLLMSSMFILLPGGFVWGMVMGARQEGGLYSWMSTTGYTVAMLMSWFSFFLFVLTLELLFSPASPKWDDNGSLASLIKFSIRITAPFAVLWVCAFWMGSVVGQIWQLLDAMTAIGKLIFPFILMAVATWGFFSTQPLFYPQSETSDVQQAAVTQEGSTQVLAQPAEQETFARDQTYEFAWTKPTRGLDSMAGMADLKNQLAAALQGFRQYPARGQVSDRNGLLLSGPPGNGKTAFAEAIAGELGLPFVKLGCQDLLRKWVNESPAVIKDLFRQASEQPCVIFFDEFDGVAMSRGNSYMSVEDRKTVTALLSEIDGARKKHIVLIAATNYVDQLDTAIIRDGRFDFRIEIPYPDQEARTAILRGLLNKFSVKSEDATIGYVAELWVRRSVAFIESTVKRLRDNGKGTKGSVASVEDFKLASREASRRASAIPNAGAKLSEIALTSDVRRETDSLLYRLRHWEEIAERGGEPPSGVLLYGPPGTGKTNLVRALARELEYWHVFEVNASDVLQDPRKFRDIMDLAANHRPAIVFIDEADELLRERTHSNAATATNEILKAMDGMMGKIPEIVFMAATNNPELIDGAALRGGRFAEKIFMGRLTGEDLVAFLEKDFTSKKRVKFAADLTPRSLAEKLIQTAPSDALGLLRKAINYTFDQGGEARPVCMADMDRAIQAMQL